MVVHGTDTMVYTASAISFALHESRKQIVLTGSQIPIKYHNSDGYLNLYCSRIVLKKGDFSGVYIVFYRDERSAYILRGTRTRKVDAIGKRAFISDRPFGVVYMNGKIEINSREYVKKGDYLGELYDKFDEKVVLVKASPTMSKILENLDDVNGIVIEGYGTGNFDRESLKLLKKLIKDGVKVVVTSQCKYAEAIYPNSIELKRVGAIYAKNMITEVAYVKLSWLIGNFGLDSVESNFFKTYHYEL